MNSSKFWTLAFLGALTLPSLLAPSCSGPAITIVAPEEREETAIHNVLFSANFENVEDESAIVATIDEVEIGGNGEVEIGGMVVTVSGFARNPVVLEFKAHGLPEGEHRFEVAVGEVTAAVTFTALASDRSCLDIAENGGGFGDGLYRIDIDGPDGEGEAFPVFCSMTLDGGGWTLIGSFLNGDDPYAGTDSLWTQFADGTNNLDNWRNGEVFGDVARFTEEDYKSPAFFLLPANDLMAADSEGNFLSFDDVLDGGTFREKVTSYTTCQTAPLVNRGDARIDSNVQAAKENLMLAFYGADPNNGGRCAFNNQVFVTDSSVVTFVGQGCGTAGLGHVGWRSPSGHEDRDYMFCLAAPIGQGCGDSWYDVPFSGWFNPNACDHALLFVR